MNIKDPFNLPRRLSGLMPEAPVFYILNPERLESATSASKWLGRIVKNYDNPSADFTPNNPASTMTESPIENTISNVTSILNSSTNSSISGKLSGIASLSRSTSRADGIDFATASIRCIRLQNHTKIFGQLIQTEEVRKDLEWMLKLGGKPAYLIVGLLVWTDATFVESRMQSRTNDAGIQLPIDVAAVAAGLPVPLPVPEFSISQARVADRTLTGISEGSHIFAVEYRTVRRRAYSVFRNFTPKLEDHGPRLKSGKIFSGEGSSDLEEKGEKTPEKNTILNLSLEMDDDTVWTDVVDNDDLEVEDFEEISLAV